MRFTNEQKDQQKKIINWLGNLIEKGKTKEARQLLEDQWDLNYEFLENIDDRNKNDLEMGIKYCRCCVILGEKDFPFSKWDNYQKSLELSLNDITMGSIYKEDQAAKTSIAGCKMNLQNGIEKLTKQKQKQQEVGILNRSGATSFRGGKVDYRKADSELSLSRSNLRGDYPRTQSAMASARVTGDIDNIEGRSGPRTPVHVQYAVGRNSSFSGSFPTPRSSDSIVNSVSAGRC